MSLQNWINDRLMCGKNFKDQVENMLNRVNGELSMTLGVLARIENNNYELVAVVSNSGAYVPGESFQLGNTYCRQVVEQEKSISTTQIDNSPETLNHPLYRSLPLECYIGAPVMKEDKPWGSLNFSSMAPRESSFTDTDVEMVNQLAEEISGLLKSNA